MDYLEFQNCDVDDFIEERRNHSSLLKKKRVIIPKGLVNPNETTIIEIPDDDEVVLASHKNLKYASPPLAKKIDDYRKYKSKIIEQKKRLLFLKEQEECKKRENPYFVKISSSSPQTYNLQYFNPSFSCNGTSTDETQKQQQNTHTRRVNNERVNSRSQTCTSTSSNYNPPSPLHHLPPPSSSPPRQFINPPMMNTSIYKKSTTYVSSKGVSETESTTIIESPSTYAYTHQFVPNRQRQELPQQLRTQRRRQQHQQQPTITRTRANNVVEKDVFNELAKIEAEERTLLNIDLIKYQNARRQLLENRQIFTSTNKH